MYLHVLCEIPLINKFDTLPLTELWNCMRLFVLQHPHSTLSEMTKKERHQKRNDSRVGRDRYSQRLFAGWFKALSIKASDKLFGTLLRGNYIRKGRNSRVSIPRYSSGRYPTGEITIYSGFIGDYYFASLRNESRRKGWNWASRACLPFSSSCSFFFVFASISTLHDKKSVASCSKGFGTRNYTRQPENATDRRTTAGQIIITAKTEQEVDSCLSL